MSSNEHACDEKRARTPRDHAGRFKRSAVARTPAESVMRFLVHDNDSERLVEIFGNRVSARAIRAWQAGERGMPQWAIDTLRALLDAHRAKVDRIDPSRGPQAGWRNLSGYVANKRQSP